MAIKPYKYPEYEPYKTITTPKKPENEVGGWYQSYDETESTLYELKQYFYENIKKTREEAAKLAIIPSGNDTLFDEALGGTWDSGTELPLLIYEVANASEDSKHKYLANIALETSRGVSGNYVLDELDISKVCLQEIDNLLEFVQTQPTQNNVLLTEINALVYALENVSANIIASKNYSSISDNYFKQAASETEESKKSAIIQKEVHEKLSKINTILTSKKRDLVELYNTSDSFYKNKISSLNTGHPEDNKIAGEALVSRGQLLADSTRNMLQVISTGYSLIDTWNKKSESSGISAPKVVESAYITSTPQNTAAAARALNNFQPVFTGSFSDAGQLFFRKQGYTAEDAIALVEMLNTLPEVNTYISAGIINVRANPEFVDALIQEINNLPANSTLISGGMIALVGKTLDEFQTEIEDAVTVEGLVNALNTLDGRNSTVLLPGVIGLSSDVDTMGEAIIGSINDTEGGETFLSGGVILAVGSNTLKMKAQEWDDGIESLQGNITSLFSADTDTGDLLSYFGITDTTLIHGSKIMTGGVLADTVLTGLAPVGSITQAQVSVGHEPIIISLEHTYYLREMRTVGSGSTPEGIVWPDDAEYFNYKLRVAPSYDTINDEAEWSYVRGGDDENWARINKSDLVDINGDPISVPSVFLLEGNNVQYLEFTFGGFYTGENAYQDLESLDTYLQVYGATTIIDGGSISTKNLSAINTKTGQLEIDDEGFIRSGKETALDNTAGFFLGYEDDTFKFALGTGYASILFDGATLSIGRGIDLGGLSPTKMIDGESTGFFSDSQPTVTDDGIKYGDYWIKSDYNRYYAYREFVLAKSPLAYWPFDDDDADVITNNGFLDLLEDRAAVMSDAIDRSYSSALPYGRSVYGNETSKNTLACSDVGTLNPDSAMTISFWFKGRNDFYAQYQDICRKYTSGGTEGWIIETMDAPGGAGRLRLNICQSSSWSNANSAYTSVSVLDGMWHHILFSVKSGTDESFCCVDGGTPNLATYGTGTLAFGDVDANLVLLYSITDGLTSILDVMTSAASMHTPSIVIS